MIEHWNISRLQSGTYHDIFTAITPQNLILIGCKHNENRNNNKDHYVYS